MSLEQTESTQAEATQETATQAMEDHAQDAASEMDSGIDDEPEDDISWATDDEDVDTEPDESGEDDTGPAEPSEESGTENKDDDTATSQPEDSTDESAEGDEQKQGDGDDEEQQESDVAKSGEVKPPKDWVPYPALKESRAKYKAVVVENESLRQQLAALQGRQGISRTQVDTPAKVQIPEEMHEDVGALLRDFPDLKDVVDADTPEGKRLRTTIQEYGPTDPITQTLSETYVTRIQHHRSESAREKAANDARVASLERDFQGHREQIAEAVPGIFDEETSEQVNAELINAMKENGLDPAAIVPLTNPGTLVAVPGENGEMQPVFMGDAAVSVVKMVAALKEKGATSAKHKFTQEDVDKAVASAVADAIKKTNTKSPSEYRSLGSAPGPADVPEDLKNYEEMTDEEWDRLPRAKRDKILGITT